MIDDEDFEKISPYKWYAHNPDGTALYAATRGKEGSDLGLNKFAYLHRYVLQAQKGQVVDHINGNTLDNRKCNLRITDARGNAHNTRKQARKLSSRFKGVHFMKRDEVWVAQILGKHLGRFDTEEKAALAYNEAAKRAYGLFAKLNEVGVKHVSNNFLDENKEIR